MNLTVATPILDYACRTDDFQEINWIDAVERLLAANCRPNAISSYFKTNQVAANYYARSQIRRAKKAAEMPICFACGCEAEKKIELAWEVTIEAKSLHYSRSAAATQKFVTNHCCCYRCRNLLRSNALLNSCLSIWQCLMTLMVVPAAVLTKSAPRLLPHQLFILSFAGGLLAYILCSIARRRIRPRFVHSFLHRAVVWEGIPSARSSIVGLSVLRE